jgi:hypothetical protein
MKAYLTDDIEFIPNPINLDRAIQEIQNALSLLTWLKKPYGRARVIPELLDGKTILLPKVYSGQKEYLNIFLNDNVDASCWFQVMGPEVPLDYAPMNRIQKYQTPLALIFWFDLEKVRLDLGADDDYIHTERIKREVHTLINRYPNITITRVYDENAKDIFREYTFNVEKDQFLTYPNAALRFEFLLTYDFDCEGGMVPAPLPDTGSNNQFLKLLSGGLSALLQIVTDGGGVSSPLKLSKTAVGIGDVVDVESMLDAHEDHTQDLNNPHQTTIAKIPGLQDQLDLKLNIADVNEHFRGTYVSLAALQAAIPIGNEGDVANIDVGIASAARQYVWDQQDGWVLGSDVSPNSTDQLPEGLTRLYFTAQRVRDALLTGLDLTAGIAITAADSFLSALGKLQKQITDVKAQTINNIAFNGNIVVPVPGAYFVGGARLYTNSLFARSISSQAVVTNNLIRAWPFLVGKRMTVTELHSSITVAVPGALIMVGVYADTGNVYPGVRMFALEFSAAAVQVISGAIANVVLEPGLYWVAAYTNLGGVSNRAVIQDQIPGVLGVSDLATNGSQGTGYSTGRAYDSTLPSVFPAGAAIAANSQALAIGLKTV